MIYLQLFLSFLQVGAFSFGGGYAAMPLIKQQVITAHHWLSVSEFTDLISISQMTPALLLSIQQLLSVSRLPVFLAQYVPLLAVYYLHVLLSVSSVISISNIDIWINYKVS